MNIRLNWVVKNSLVGIYFFLITLACRQNSTHHQVVNNDPDHFFYFYEVCQVTDGILNIDAIPDTIP